MKKLLLLLTACWPLLSQAATYTACWDSVNPTEHYAGIAYMICVDSADPATLNPAKPLECAGSPYFTMTPTISFPSPDTAWIRTRAVIWDLTSTGTQTNVRWGPYSMTQKISYGITPPIIGCGCP